MRSPAGDPGPSPTWLGDAAWRLPLPAAGDRRAVLDALRALEGVTDAVVTEHEALVAFEPGAPPERAEVERALRHAGRAADLAASAPVRLIRVVYDGPDLDAVARFAGLELSEVIALHAAATYRVASVGFLPGFAYLRGGDPRLAAPRRATPRPRVPALAVGIAGPYTGIYPFASPGGWNLVGRAVDFVAFDPEQGAGLALGDRVKLLPVTP